MKKLILLLILLSAGTLTAQKINWMTMNEALAAQKKEPKKIFMDVYTDWCGPCKLLDRNTFSNKKVINTLFILFRNHPMHSEPAKAAQQVQFLFSKYEAPFSEA